jgi:thiamine transport system ATP-binding protein
MLDLLADVRTERRMTVILVSHQPDDARRIADRIVFLEAGRVAANGATDEMFGDHAPVAFRRYVGDRQGTA